MSAEQDKPDVMVSTKPQEQEETRTRQIPPYNVILHNDEHHSFEFVIQVLRKALGYSQEQAHVLTEEAHTSGRAIVWTGPKVVAEFKVEQIQTFHEIREPNGAKLGPLDCTIEPVA